MPLTVSTSGLERYLGITLNNFIEEVERQVDPDDIQSLEPLAPAFAALSKDRDLLPNYFAKYVDSMLNSTVPVAYTPQSFVLGGGRKHFIRANVWIPLRFASTLRSQEEKIFSYRQAHDHNFSFMTIGHFGPGYETDLWQYNPSTVQGLVGERVELEPLGREQLTLGRAILFREKTDVHIQLPPESLSISLNVMVLRSPSKLVDQFFFDTDKSCISGLPLMATPHKRSSIIELVSHLPNENIFGVLDDLARGAKSWRIRAAALKGCVISPSGCLVDKELLLDSAFSDPDARIRQLATSLQSTIHSIA